MNIINYIEIRNGDSLIARVGYEPESRCLRIKDLAAGTKQIRVWSPAARDFRVAAMNEDEGTVDVKWEIE